MDLMHKYSGVRPHKETAQIFTHLSVVSSRQRSYDWLRCEEVTLGRGKG